MNGRLGAPVIDELRLCNVAEPSLLEELSRVEVGAFFTVSPFILYRVGGDRFQYQFVVCMVDIGEREEVATMKYGRYAAADIWPGIGRRSTACFPVITAILLFAAVTVFFQFNSYGCRDAAAQSALYRGDEGEENPRAGRPEEGGRILRQERHG